MAYVDGFVIVVPEANKEAYIKFAEACVPHFKKHGALRLVETWEEDVPEGDVTSFPLAVKRKPGEAIVFSWIFWPDKATRDAGNKKVMEDMEAEGFAPADPPFDGQRMIFGGFETIVDA